MPRKALIASMMSIIERPREAAVDEFRRAFEYAGVGMAMTDAADRFVRVNRKFADMLGYGVDEMLGAASEAFTAGDYRGATEQRRAALIAGEAHEVTADKKLVHRDGSQV